jgi:hypothetical protein
MPKRKAQKKAVGFRTAAKGRSAVPRSRATAFGRPDLLILLSLAVMTFGIYAQVIGHQFITLDDDSYIKENPMVNRGVTLAGLLRTRSFIAGVTASLCLITPSQSLHLISSQNKVWGLSWLGAAGTTEPRRILRRRCGSCIIIGEQK